MSLNNVTRITKVLEPTPQLLSEDKYVKRSNQTKLMYVQKMFRGFDDSIAL